MGRRVHLSDEEVAAMREVELGPDIIEGAWNRSLVGKIRSQREEIDRLGAELANVKAAAHRHLDLLDAAEARLAAVIALCDEHQDHRTCPFADIRAAATGEQA